MPLIILWSYLLPFDNSEVVRLLNDSKIFNHFFFLTKFILEESAKFSFNIFCKSAFVWLVIWFQHFHYLFCFDICRLAWFGDEAWKRTSSQCDTGSKVSRGTCIFSLQDHNTVQQTADENKETRQSEATYIIKFLFEWGKITTPN